MTQFEGGTVRCPQGPCPKKAPIWGVSGVRGLMVIFGALAVLAITLLTTACKRSSGGKPTEVAVLGGNHLAYLYDPDYSPAHLRALIAKLKPDVIAIENLPEWQVEGRRFWTFLPEYCVAGSYASATGIPVVGVDFDSLSGHEETCVEFRKHLQKTSPAEQRREMDQVARSVGEWQAGLAFRETPGGIDEVHRKFAEEDKDPESIQRDDRIAENIVNEAARFPGKRMVAILGSYHLGPQAKRLARQASVRPIDVRQYLPLRTDEIDAAWQRTDYNLVLGASLDSWIAPAVQPMRNHQRTKELLARLKRLDPNSALTRYFEARWQLIFGRNDKAKALLQAIVNRPSPEQAPCHTSAEWSWPPWDDLRDKASFVLATVLDEEGDRAGAVAIYKRLLATLPEYQLRPRSRGAGLYHDLRQYLENLLREPYRGGVEAASRSREVRRCWLAAETPADAWPR